MGSEIKLVEAAHPGLTELKEQYEVLKALCKQTKGEQE